MMSWWIINEDGEEIEERDPIKAAKFFDEGVRKVATSFFADKNGNEIMVSTVFLVLDHRFGRGLPLLYETMIFGGEHDMYQKRYTTRVEAKIGHEEAVNLVKKSIGDLTLLEQKNYSSNVEMRDI